MSSARSEFGITSARRGHHVFVEVIMVKVSTLVVACVLLAPACSGPDVDIGNGSNGVRGNGQAGASGSAAATGTTGSATAGAGTGTTGSATAGAGGAPGTGTGGAGGSSGGGTVQEVTAVLMRYADIPRPGGSGTSSTGGSSIDPDTPYLFLGNGPPTCSDPWAGPPCGFWRVTISIPPALLQPGILLLNDPRLISSHSETEPNQSAGVCSGGGGSFVAGALEIVEVGSGTATIRLSDTSTSSFNANGSYQVKRCP